LSFLDALIIFGPRDFRRKNILFFQILLTKNEATSCQLHYSRRKKT
jgi:hypothetical protein